MPIQILLITCLTIAATLPAMAEDVTQEQIDGLCKKAERQLMGKLGQLTHKDLIKDGFTMAQANTLLTIRATLGCAPVSMATKLLKHPALK